MEIYCIADDFCKEYELELNKKRTFAFKSLSPNAPKTRNRKGRMSDAEMITTLVLFNNNTFRNFKHFYLFLRSLSCLRDMRLGILSLYS